jgi:hypothetical protein
MLLVGLLSLHLPRYLHQPAGLAAYHTYPGLILVAVAAAAAAAAVGVMCHREWGWWLGNAVAAATFVLYLVQEMGGLDGLERS